MTNIATLGHNNAPDDLALLQEKLSNDHANLLQRADDLAAAKERITDIADDEAAGKVTEYIKQINACVKAFEDKRKGEKDIFIRMGNVVDSFFKQKDTALAKAKTFATGKLDEYMRIQAEQRRQAMEAEAQRLREEAEERAALAAEQENANMKEANKTMQGAIVTEAKAERFQKAADTGTGLAVSRSTEGSTASIRKVWTAEITSTNDLDLEALRPYLPLAALQQAANAYMRDGGRELKGARIYEKTSTVVR